MKQDAVYIRWLADIRNEDVGLVGGKNASLGEMYSELTPKGVKIPDGFAVTAEGYWHVLESAGILDDLKETLAGLDRSDVADLARRGKRARDLILAAGIPDDLWGEIRTAYDMLCDEYGPDADVAVRSSATAEDLPTASFAGQQETYLNVRGYQALREAYIRCLASLFTDRAIAYRVDNGFDHFKVALSAGVMKMVRSDLAASGVIFTLDTDTGFRDVVLVTGSYGLGEMVVQGAVNPDEFYVFKPTFRKGYRSIVRKIAGEKRVKLIYGHGGSKEVTRQVDVPEIDRRRFCITDDDILALAGYALTIEDHYSAKANKPVPMDIEWAKDGETNELFVVQARPETVQSQKAQDVLETFHLDGRGKVLAAGKSIGDKIAVGKARIITDVGRLSEFRPGEVLVSDTTTPDWEPVMKTAAAIVTNRGGRTSHAAIVSRELGIPAVVGTGDATEKVPAGREVTVSCAEGEKGFIYEGSFPFHVEKTPLSDLRRPKTEVMMNLGNPDMAFGLAMLPNDGIGLARMEFIISSYIKVHPMALVHPEQVADESVRQSIADLTYGYPDGEEYFVARLAEGVGTIAAAFYPNPVVVRTSDFKTNEYANLLGGTHFEPEEANPMLGFRGAVRYYDERYREGFALECRALKRVREEMGLTNLIIMIPFCRRVEEARRVIGELEKNGLSRGENSLQIYQMCEIPSNIVEMDAFSEYFDGFSIGSNDLTQLVLGIDRDSAVVSEVFDERDPAVKRMVAMAVEGCRRNRRHSGLCGEAPSTYPEFADFLVEQGIDSISVEPDALLKITLRVAEVEERLAREKMAAPVPR
ncbi:phosphoenolpyruvate synthase [Methanoculleus sp.]|uniref:phosphoenolpyruvate synthase n=1 Tax=Methanoculleus sp. TaxID=90427 RepID=UPI0025E87206|nr:phosphoenolpyruvate synthase [Methanoculleus sp.]